MNTIEKCSEVLKKRSWTQRELAKELGMTEQNMTHVMKGRRDLPAHALAKLERLRGTDDRAIVDLIIKHAACIALAAVTLFVTLPPKNAYASSPYGGRIARNADSHAFRRRLVAAIEQLARTLGRWGMLRAA